jgi:succinate dehydrogenase/fumarate reductase cytochrome b subunit
VHFFQYLYCCTSVTLRLPPLGIEAFNAYQQSIRSFYQHPLIELVIVIGPILAHAIAGIWLFVPRRKQPQRQRPLLSRLHSWAGCFLLLFILGHIAAVRGPSFFADVFPEFEGVAFSLWYLPYYFYPYYFLLALAGFYHATNGLRTIAARNGIAISRSIQINATVIAAIWIAVSLLSFGGVLVPVENPADNDFARLLGSIWDADPTTPIRIFGG